MLFGKTKKMLEDRSRNEAFCQIITKIQHIRHILSMPS